MSAKDYYDAHTKLIAGDGAPIRCAAWVKTLSQDALDCMYRASVHKWVNGDHLVITSGSRLARDDE